MRQTGGAIAVTLILPSAINTPFFDHARSKTGLRPKPLAPVYEPSVVAEAILFAAQHPRRDVYAGRSSSCAVSTRFRQDGRARSIATAAAPRVRPLDQRASAIAAATPAAG